MKLIHFILILAITVGFAHAADKRLADIQWKPNDCSSPLMLPKNQWGVSQFGKGKYRIDGVTSRGRFNCIYIIFQKKNSLDPDSVPDAIESSFTVNGQTVIWRTFKTTVEGRSVIRREALMPNTLPRQKNGDDSDYIWLRMDADSQEILDSLTPDAEEIIQTAAEKDESGNGG